VDSIKKFLPLVLLALFLIGLGIFFWKMASSRAAVKEVCKENIIGKEISYLEGYASKNHLRFGCYKNNACRLTDDITPDGPSCDIRHSLDKKITDYDYIPVDGKVTGKASKPSASALEAAASRKAITEVCMKNIVGKELSYLEEYASKNDLMFRCRQNDNACILRLSPLLGEPSCLILYSSDKKVIDYKFFPAATTSNGHQPE